MAWDPAHYLQHADERGRPFHDLLARVGAEDPRTVVDLGCGPGNLTVTLAERWPEAGILGLDSSAEMISRARQLDSSVSWLQADIVGWSPPDPVDVIVSNAALQWVEDYVDLLPGLLAHLSPGGWFAMQVPYNHDQPLHRILRELCAEPEFAPYLRGITRTALVPGREVGDRLLGLGCSVDVWETTYEHLLTGPDPIFGWISATGARPALDALSGQVKERFIAIYKERLRQAYPAGPHGTWLSFPRSFVVARKPG
ncbi:methyltransferase domain-containing protein [Naumannella halotolerans]|uniref:methyltransferase domain-containing protein n=1 Tax=Naumannella halotolerans TaxID=993414 RepID=UPI00370D227B